ncbi:MAG: hypothetical protein KDA79_24245, partial [Planctomycetaceae bacterium]|nr:hypothetical protein [Planctomycetaceae bacterium]
MTGQSHNPLELIDDYVHGLLTGSELKAVEEFCHSTPEGQAALEQARARQAALQTLPMVEAPESLIQQTLAGISEKTESRRRRIRRYFGTLAALTAAFVFIVGGMQLYYGLSSPPRYDIRLVGQAQLLAGSPAALRLEVFDMQASPQRPGTWTAPAVGQVPLKLILADPRTNREIELVSAETDNSGSFAPAFEVPDWETGDYELRVLTGTGSGANADGRLIRTVRIERASRLMLSTDKPVYQPGQTIHMRALGLRQPDGKPVADEPAELTITDPKGNLIFRHSGTTSRFGLTSADCPL